MSLYTIRYRLALPTFLGRGAPFTEMTFHAQWADDAHAIDALPGLISLMTDEPMARRWLVVRGGFPAHECAIYRRSIEDKRAWHHVIGGLFGLADWQAHNFSVPIPESALQINFSGGESPLYPDQRGAVLVRLRDGSTGRSRRVYLGPVSPIPFILEMGIGTGSSSLLDIHGLMIYDNLFSLSGNGDDAQGDFPDSLDYWRQDFAEDAARFVVSIANAIESVGDGFHAIPSWQHSAVDSVTQIQASMVRAHIRTRGVRGAMTPNVLP